MSNQAVLNQKLKTVDKIVLYLQDTSGRSPEEFGLTKNQAAQLERLNFADNLVRKYKVTKKVLAMLVKRFGYSEMSARQDLRHAKIVFNSIGTHEKEYDRQRYIEQLEEAAQMALEMEPPNLKDHAKIMDLIYKFGRFSAEDIQPVEEFVPHQIVVVNDPTLMNRPRIENLDEVIGKYIKKRDIKKLEADDAEYSE